MRDDSFVFFYKLSIVDNRIFLKNNVIYSIINNQIVWIHVEKI